jgi:hypothetical protein
MSDFASQLPKTNSPIAIFEQSWNFPARLQTQVAAYACQFAKPFWAPFDFNDAKSVRTATLPAYPYPPGTGPVLITETLQQQAVRGNTYTLAGLPGVERYQGALVLTPAGRSQVRLTWKIQFNYASTDALVVVAQVFAGGATYMTAALVKEFGTAVKSA